MHTYKPRLAQQVNARHVLVQVEKNKINNWPRMTYIDLWLDDLG